MNINQPSKNFIQMPWMKRQETAESRQEAEAKNELRLPGVGFLPNKVRNHFIAMVGEFLGTFLFLFFAFTGTQVANGGAMVASTDTALAHAPNPGVLVYISLAFGFSLMVNVWVFFRISGGLFNPAVTLGLAMIGAITWIRAGLVLIAELFAAMAAAGIVSALFPGPLNVSTTLNSTTSVARGLFIEMFLTFELIITIFMLAAEKHKGTFLAPVGIGLSLFICELAGVYYTGGSLNPARSFGPCVANKAFPHYHWIYWLGPCLGAVLAVGFYRFIKMLEYETANPGADFNEKEQENFTFDEDTARGSDVQRPVVAIDSSGSMGMRSHSRDLDLESGSRVNSMEPHRPMSNSMSSPHRPNSVGHDQIPGMTDRLGSRGSEHAYHGAPAGEQGGLGGGPRPYPST